MRNAPRPLIAHCSIAALAFCAASIYAASAAANDPAAVKSAADVAQPVPAAVAVPAPLTGPQVIQLLDQTIDWYRDNSDWLAGVRKGDYLSYYDKYYVNRDTSLHAIADGGEPPR